MTPELQPIRKILTHFGEPLFFSAASSRSSTAASIRGTSLATICRSVLAKVLIDRLRRTCNTEWRGFVRATPVLGPRTLHNRFSIT